jgi:hypothetical protein
LDHLIFRDGEDLLELIAGMQSKRMDEQRVTLPYLPGLNTNKDADDSFIEMLVRCQVRIIALSRTLLYIIRNFSKQAKI